jgi:hypothetical protein
LPEAFAAAVWSLREIYYGVGQLSGMAGHKYQEYRSAGMDSVEKIPELASSSEDRKQPA